MERATRESRGQVLVLVALAIVVLLGVIGLAVDLGRAYGVRAKLNAAVDAASLEAANALAQGNGEAAMVERAKTVAADYFSANYPGSFLGATPDTPVVTAVRNGMTGSWRVNVSARAKMPTVFARLLELSGLGGLKLFDIAAESEAVRATLDMVLVLDTTNSMKLPQFNVFPEVQAAAQRFVENFSQLDDRVGLVAFSTGAYPIVSICSQYPNEIQNPEKESLDCGRGFSQTLVKEAISGLFAGGTTASEEGMKKALDQLDALGSNARSGRRVIVFFSDGSPNTFNGRFPLKNGGTVEGNLYSGPRGEEPNLVYDASKYYDDGKFYQVAAVPEYDAKGRVATKGYHSKRAMSGATDISSLRCDANKAARNMVENVANQARREGITVFALGFGLQLDQPEMVDQSCSTHQESGSAIMKRLANTPDSDTYDRSQPAGIFCHAPTVNDLERCFDQIAYGILRITR